MVFAFVYKIGYKLKMYTKMYTKSKCIQKCIQKDRCIQNWIHQDEVFNSKSKELEYER